MWKKIQSSVLKYNGRKNKKNEKDQNQVESEGISGWVQNSKMFPLEWEEEIIHLAIPYRNSLHNQSSESEKSKSTNTKENSKHPSLTPEKNSSLLLFSSWF